MRRKRTRAVLAAAVLCAALLPSCKAKRNPLANTMWRFVYEEGDYVVFSFSEFYFSFTDYRVYENGRADYYEVTGSYEIQGDTLIITGENGKILMDGELVTNPSLRKGWDGEYKFAVLDGALALTRGGATVRLQRTRL